MAVTESLLHCLTSVHSTFPDKSGPTKAKPKLLSRQIFNRAKVAF